MKKAYDEPQMEIKNLIFSDILTTSATANDVDVNAGSLDD